MKFRGDFQFNEYRLGHFYKSDVKNLVGYAQSYPMCVDDSMRDPSVFFRQAAESQHSLFCTIKRDSDVLGYGLFLPIANGIGQLHIVKRPMLRLPFADLKGMGRCLLCFGFTVLGLCKITTVVPVEWKPGWFLASICGMLREGCLRKTVSISGKRYDAYVYGMLRGEF